jgi:hypothetical protein
MPNVRNTTLASDAEIEAALTEAEAQAAGIPSLDDGREQTIVPVPVQPDSQPVVKKRLPQDVAPVVVVAAPTEEQPPEPPSAISHQPAAGRFGWLRRLAPRLLALLRLRRTLPVPSAETPAQSSAPDTAAPAQQQPPPAEPRPALPAGRIVYRALDALLAAVNWPFNRMGPEARQLVGILATVTIVVSLLAAHFLPILLPPRDAISQLHQRVLQTQTGPAPTAAHATESH